MECKAHPGTEATSSCEGCKRPLCDACAAYELEGRVFCAECGRKEEARHASLGSLLLAFVAVGYLAALAIGVRIFHASPLVGGAAAIVAIGLGRVMQVLLRTSTPKRSSKVATGGNGPAR